MMNITRAREQREQEKCTEEEACRRVEVEQRGTEPDKDFRNIKSLNYSRY